MPSSSQERRLNKISPLFILIDNIKKLIFPALVALFGTKGSSWEYIALGIAAFVSLGSIVQYRFYRYWLEPTRIRVKEGIIFRNVRQVNYNKIQNLHLVQNPLHKMFRVAKVQLESASGGKPEAVINVISVDAVIELRKRIHGEETQAETEESAPDRKEKQVLLGLNFAEIVKYGIITNRGLIAVGVFFGFFFQAIDGSQFEQSIKQRAITFANSFDSLVQGFIPTGSILSTIIYGTVLFLIALLFLWLLSILMALFKFHGYKLKEVNSKLVAKMGLLTQVSGTIPMSRIQTVTVRNSPLHRRFKRISISVETAGGVNTDQQGITFKQIAPVLPSAEQSAFLDKIQAETDWSERDWQPIEARAWKRLYKKVVVIFALLLLTTINISIYLYLGSLLGVMVLAYFYSKAWIRRTSYSICENAIGFRKGVFFRKEIYAPLSKIQTTNINENPFDRRHKMASLELDTAGSIVGAFHIDIPYITNTEALKLQQFIIAKVKNSQFEW